MSWMTLEITDGITTINLVDGVNFSLTSWSPAVSKKRLGVLGGRSLYEEVEEEIVFNMFGSTILQNFLNLTKVMDRVDKQDGVVTIRVQPQGSTLAYPVEARIVSNGGIFLPANIYDLLMIDEVEDVVIRFRRQGLWLGGTDTGSDTGTSNPYILSVTMSEELDFPGPTKVTFNGFSSGMGGFSQGGWVMTDNGSTELQLIACEDMTGDGVKATDTFGANVGGYVRRFQSTTTAIQSIEQDVNITGVETIQLFAMCRASSQAISQGWVIRAWSVTEHHVTYPISFATRWREISGPNPGLINLGTISNPLGEHETIKIDVVSVQNDVTTVYAYLDYLAIVPVTEYNVVGQMLQWATGQTSVGSNLVFDHRALTHDSPLGYVENASTGASLLPMSARNSVYAETAGQTLKLIFMSNDGVDYFVDGEDIGVEIERYKTYLVPQ